MTSAAHFVKVRGVPRRNKHLLHELIDPPWWVSIIVAALVFAGIRWFLPTLGGASNQFLQPLGAALHGCAWWFTLPFLATAGNRAIRNTRGDSFLMVKAASIRCALSWQDFERLVGEAYRRRGYTVEETGGSAPDGGVDLLIYVGNRKTEPE